MSEKEKAWASSKDHEQKTSLPLQSVIALMDFLLLYSNLLQLIVLKWLLFVQLIDVFLNWLMRIFKRSFR